MTIENLVTMSANPAGNTTLRALHFIAKFAAEGNIVSVNAPGGWVDFALALNANVPVWAISDASRAEVALWHANAQELALGEKAKRFVGDWTEPIGMLYVDASTPDLRTAFLEYLSFVLPDAYVALGREYSEQIRGAVSAAQEYYKLTPVEEGIGYVVYQFKGSIKELVSAPKATNIPAKQEIHKVAAKPAATKRPAAKKKKAVRRPAVKAK